MIAFVNPHRDPNDKVGKYIAVFFIVLLFTILVLAESLAVYMIVQNF